MRNFKLIFCLLFTWLGLLQVIDAQAQSQITGRVKSAAGENLPGVTVLLKGTTTGTTTDANGTYNLSVPVTSGTLVFSFIGYTTLERNFAQPGTLDVTLATDAKALDEVIVTALGIKREAKKLGYATSTVNTDQITTTRTTNVGNSLVGKVAGLNVQAPPSGPGGSSKIRIRGQSSFGANNSPLIIVNGVPINNSTGGSANSGGTGFNGEARTDTGDGLQSINPDDIESMTVLKGAAAAALYGFRAANGAIIITTKSGKGQTGIGVELNSNFQADEALDYTDFQYEYGQGENGIRPQVLQGGPNAARGASTGTGTWSFGERFDGKPTISFDGQTHPYSPYRDRVKDFYRTGTTWTNSVALSGGNEKGNFRLSFANTDANSIIPNSEFHKKIMNFGLTYSLTDKLSTQLNANYSNEYNRNPPVVAQQDYNINQTLYTIANSLDVAWLEAAYQDENGNEIFPSRFTNRTNPYWTINKRLEENRRDRIFGNASIRYQFTPWLYAQGRVGQDYFTNPYNANRPTGTAFLTAAPVGFNGNFYQRENTFRERNLDFLVGANREFGKFGIDLTVGGNSMDIKTTSLGTSVTNFYVRDLYTIGNGQVKEPQASYSQNRVNSLFGTVDFSFNNYLFLNLTGRNDWFSTLNPESNSYLYPSISTSFVFSQAFTTLPAWLSYGKIRAAYAEVGGATDPYQNALFYNINANPLSVNGTNYALGNISGLVSPNQNLRPLSVKEAEAGLELRTLDSRVNLDISFYRKNTVDEILNVDISNTSGFNQTKVNVGQLRNQGIEAMLTLEPVRTEPITWTSTFNFTINKSEVLELANNQTRFDVANAQDLGAFIGYVSHEVGKPLASLRGFDYRRDDQGRILTSNGRFAQGNLITYGSAIPTHTGGWLNTVTFKGIRLFTQIDFKAGHKLISNSNFNWMRHGLHKASLVGREGGVVMAGAVNADGSPNTVAVPAQEFYNNYRSVNVTTPFVYDASFVRWRTVSLGYDFSRFVSKSFVKGLAVNAFINNVLIIKKHVDNLDPETQFSASDLNTGLEAHALPTTRSYGLNLNIKL
ncbi:SusC/RagA family TonB-linked outer membrane protein [Adhaeribacter rhizoryzae]|uniref:SusC/RagA family TonB-linked outer membrane protein n=1 Tax=Adhaeribacter rhizoryzae TaxID=2607907 RepID=A0A5M6D5W0_9BACT|nr:SusC/RagA family TonB-linked outer membrane protein [Adhaeribacter rhizoryzae]KAA5542894.1 SusC/RagA family TonB-linked outer membrane protein [Adhaeribacter rhizoryzae]